MSSFDRYNLTARLAPATLALAPAVIAVLAWSPARFAGWGALAGVLATCGASRFLMHFARDAGTSIEPWLYTRWGGSPAVEALRHRSGVMDDLTRTRAHRLLAQCVPETVAPSRSDEERGPAAADAVYQTWGRWLLEATRDKKTFDILFDENMSYGFRRNVYGLRPWGLALSLAGLASAGAKVASEILVTGTSSPAAGACAGVLLLSALAWAFVVSPDWVRRAGRRYAQRLVAACERLALESTPQRRSA